MNSARKMKLLILAGVLSAAPVFGAAASPAISVAAASAAKNAALEKAFADLAKQTDGTVGVAVQSVKGGPLYTLNGGERFPMASTFKISVAAKILSLVDKGDLSLDTMVEVDPQIVVPSDGIAAFAPHPGVSLSIHNLLELMLTRSDNTATDILVAQAGGPAAVTDWIRSVGVKDQRVDGDTARIIYRALDVTPGEGTFTENIEAAFEADPSIKKMDIERIPNKEFDNDPRDSTTPEAMAKLLQAVHDGEGLKPDSAELLIRIMERCITGEKRLKGLLPEGTVVAHKTGSLMGIANDVGVVTLPDGRQFVIAVYVKGDTKGTETQDRVIAEIARTAYDFFLMSGE